MLRLVFSIILSAMFCDLLFADTLILKSGKVLECKIQEKSKDYIKVEYAGQPLYYEYKYVQQVHEDASEFKADLPKQLISAQEWSKEIADEKRSKSSNYLIKAVILTNSSEGFSPLKVVFNGLKSSSTAGRIVSYNWDFGDGDVAVLPKVQNTYINMNYGSKIYMAKLTVKDEKGNTASALTRISVKNKNL